MHATPMVSLMSENQLDITCTTVELTFEILCHGFSTLQFLSFHIQQLYSIVLVPSLERPTLPSKLDAHDR
jgi:hypothetical protein